MGKAIYIITIVIMVVILVAYGIWVYSTYKNGTGWFKVYEPTPGKGLKTVYPPGTVTKLSEEKMKLKEDLVNKALEKASSKA